MKKFFDGALNLLRKKTLINFFKSLEVRISKIGVFCLYAVLPFIIAIFSLNYEGGLKNMYGPGAVAICFGFAVACILLGYVADKMLEYVRPSIEQAKTSIVNGAFFDTVALLIAIPAIVGLIFGFIAIIAEHDNISIAVFLLSVMALYFSIMLLSPDQMLNVNVQKSATPAQSLIAIVALIIKSLYRLVPLAFGVFIIWSVIDGIDMTFISTSVTRLDVHNFVQRLISTSLLPLVGYFVFLTYYFVLDLCMSLFRIADATEKLAETKSQKTK